MAQLIIEGEEPIPFEDEAKVQSERVEEKDFQDPAREEDFEIFYHANVTEDTIITSTLEAIAVSTNKKATQVPEGMVIEKRVPDLLALLESYANEATSKVLVVL